jgi:phage tail sheath gpL-like
LIGQKTTSGTVTAKTLTQVFNEEQVSGLAGVTSMLHNMAKRYFKNNTTTETFIVALDDDAAGTQATRVLSISGTATENGELPIYINGYRIPVTVVKRQLSDKVA